MEQRQPDEPNEPRTDPSPEQPSDYQKTINQPTDAPSSAEQPPAAEGDSSRRRDGQQTPNQRGNRQQNGRNNGGQRGNQPDRNGESGSRNDRSGKSEPRDGGPESAEPNGAGTSLQEDVQRSRSQRTNNQKDNAPREDAPRNNRNDSRPDSRDRSTNPREHSPGNRVRDVRYSSEVPDSETNLREADSQENQTTEFEGRDERLVIGISLGDYNGVGPEVILKALQYNHLQKICTPVIYGSLRILNRYRNLLDMKDWNLNGIPAIGQISHKLTNVITCWSDQSHDIQPGQVTPDAGQAALACLQRAVDDLKDGKLDALVTAPINKYNIQSEEFQFPGHTEYLAQQFGVADNLMFMVRPSARQGVYAQYTRSQRRAGSQASLASARFRRSFARSRGSAIRPCDVPCRPCRRSRRLDD